MYRLLCFAIPVLLDQKHGEVIRGVEQASVERKAAAKAALNFTL